MNTFKNMIYFLGLASLLLILLASCAGGSGVSEEQGDDTDPNTSSSGETLVYLSKQVVTTIDDGDGEVLKIVTYKYDSQESLTLESTDEHGDGDVDENIISTYEYDSTGNPTKITSTENKDGRETTRSLVLKHKYENNLLTLTEFFSEGNNSSYMESDFTYDEDSANNRYTITAEFTSTVEYPEGAVVVGEFPILAEVTVNKDEQLIEQYFETFSSSWGYTYKTLTYDDNGNLLTEKFEYSQNNIGEPVTTYHYYYINFTDDDGHLLARLRVDYDDRASETIFTINEVSSYQNTFSDGSTVNSIDEDADGFPKELDCDDSNPEIKMGALKTCDSELDEGCEDYTLYCGYYDFDGDGNSEYDGDCDDENENVGRFFTEICDGLDNDCDGIVDENLDCDEDNENEEPDHENDENTLDTLTTTTYYADTDGDGYGDPNSTYDSSSQPEGYVLDNTDCNDTNEYIHPDRKDCAAFQLGFRPRSLGGDNVDNDCDGQIDEDSCGLIMKKIPFKGNLRRL